MTTLVFYTLFAFGFVYVAGHSVISLPARELIAVWSEFLITLIECPACLGFWVGAAVGILAVSFYGYGIPLLFMLPFYTAGSNYLLARLTGIIPNPQEK